MLSANSKIGCPGLFGQDQCNGEDLYRWKRETGEQVSDNDVGRTWLAFEGGGRAHSQGGQVAFQNLERVRNGFIHNAFRGVLHC